MTEKKGHHKASEKSSAHPKAEKPKAAPKEKNSEKPANDYQGHSKFAKFQKGSLKDGNE